MSDQIVNVDGEFFTERGQNIHPLLSEANNMLWCAGPNGVSVFAREAPESASEWRGARDTVIVVLRGDAARAGRVALVAVADLLR